MLTTTLILELLVLVLLLAFSAFFSGTETALFSLSKLQLRRLRQEHPARGQVVKELLDQPHRLLSTIVLDNTVVNVGAPVVGYGLLKAIASGRAKGLYEKETTTEGD